MEWHYRTYCILGKDWGKQNGSDVHSVVLVGFSGTFFYFEKRRRHKYGTSSSHVGDCDVGCRCCVSGRYPKRLNGQYMYFIKTKLMSCLFGVRLLSFLLLMYIHVKKLPSARHRRIGKASLESMFEDMFVALHSHLLRLLPKKIHT